ncbi:MAG: hypothetical protein AAF616_10285 [Bacteroidota bacterium]
MCFLLLNQRGTAQMAYEMTVKTGLASDYFSWNIAGDINGNNPNVFSELVWENVLGFQAEHNLRVTYREKISFQLTGAKTLFFTGKVTDTDFASDNRQDVVFFEELQADGSKSHLIGISGGYTLLHKKNWIITQYAGFRYSDHRYRIIDSDIVDLDSEYHARWIGFFSQTGVYWKFNNKLRFSGNFIYEQLDYSAEARWNLIEIFRQPLSFDHRAKGYGISGSLLCSLNIFKNFDLGLEVRRHKRTTGAGIENLYLVDGPTLKTKVNKAMSKRSAMLLVLHYRL